MGLVFRSVSAGTDSRVQREGRIVDPPTVEPYTSRAYLDRLRDWPFEAGATCALRSGANSCGALWVSVDGEPRPSGWGAPRAHLRSADVCKP